MFKMFFQSNCSIQYDSFQSNIFYWLNWIGKIKQSLADPLADQAYLVREMINVERQIIEAVHRLSVIVENRGVDAILVMQVSTPLWNQRLFASESMLELSVDQAYGTRLKILGSYIFYRSWLPHQSWLNFCTPYYADARF